MLEPLPHQQQTIKESQDVEYIDPAMLDKIHMMRKTTPGVNN